MNTDNIRITAPLFPRGIQQEPDPSKCLSAGHLLIGRISLREARLLNRAWHSRLPGYGRGCVTNQSDLCFGAEYQGRLFAIAIWSNRVARNLPQHEWLELRRFAIAPDAPNNTGSRMLAVMARLIRQCKPSVTTLVSYQDLAVHAGTIYRAAGWTPTVIVSGRDWNCPSRHRPAVHDKADKQRWEKRIR